MNCGTQKTDFEALFPIIREAGKIMLSAHDIESGDNVHDKFGTSNFVTYYDVKVQNFLMERISGIFPEAVFIAEEKDNDPALSMEKLCFIIDPIDGTTNFIHDYKTSCVSVGIVSGGKPVFGAVYDPYRGELFHAETGRGAYLNDQPIHVADHPLDHALVAFGSSPYYKDTLADKTFDMTKELFLTCADIRRSGSAALDIAFVACGRSDIFTELILSPWDYTAGSIIVTEAGGVMTDVTGKPLQYGNPSSILATTPRLLPELVKMLEKYN